MPKKIKFFSTENILVSVGLFFVFVIRVFRLDKILYFNFDQGRDALVIWDLIHKGKFFLIGPTTGIAGIFRGPFYYYLIAPFYWLGKGNPTWPAVFLVATSVAALAIMYFLGKQIGGKLTGVLALILGGFSYQIIIASRWLSNPTPMLLLSMILVLSMFLIYDGKKWAWMMLSTVLGLSLFHFGSSGEVFYFPAVAIFAIWKFFFAKGKTKNIPSLKIIFISIGVFIFTVLPLVLFDMKHGGILGGNIKEFLVTGKSFSFPTWRFVTDRLSLVADYFSSLLFGSPKEILWGMGFVTIYFLSRLVKNSRLNIVLLLLASPIFGLIFFQGNYGFLYNYYLTGYFLIFLLFISASLAYIFKSSVVGKIIVLIFMIFFFTGNFSDIKSYLSNTGNGSGNIVFETQKEAVNWVYTAAGTRDFNVDEYVPPVIPYSYNYLFTWLGTTEYHKLPVDPQVSLLYTLYEVDPSHPELLQAWLVRQNGIGKIITEKTFGGITVQERERLNK